MELDLKKIHEESLLEFAKIESSSRGERDQALEDRRFYSIAGAQWEGDLEKQFENKPRFEFNKVHLSIIRIINEWRSNKISVDFSSNVGADELADTLDGLYRADMENSGADEALDNAFEEGVGGGIGAWRLRAKYEDEYDDEDENQRIFFEPIYDADSCVYFDLGAKRQDKSDAKSCYILTAIPIDQYIEEYGDDLASWPKAVEKTEFDWYTTDVVYIAEKYKVESVPHTVFIFKDIEGNEKRYTDEDFNNDPMLGERLEATGAKQVRKKTVKRQKIHKFIMNGNEILEDAGYIAGTEIPIVPVYGKRWFIDNVERSMGHVRLSKDAQRLLNMLLSKLGEIVSLSPLEKPILTPEQVLGHEDMWSEDNIKDFPYLLINTITDKDGNEVATGPIGYTKAPEVPAPLAAMISLTQDDIKELLGNQQAGEEVVANLSGRALELIQSRLDMQVYIYMSNMAKSIKRSGHIWLGMARELYAEDGRKMEVIGKQDEQSTIVIKKPIETEGGIKYENDIKNAKAKITVGVGPSSNSQRSATLRELSGMLQLVKDPELIKVLSSMMVANMEGEGITESKEYFRKILLRMGAAKPTEAEAKMLEKEAADQKPDANQEFLMASAANELARAEKAKADTLKSIAQIDQVKAETMETLSGIDQSELEAYVKVRQLTQQSTPGA